MHASSEPASNGWTKPFDTTKDRMFTTRWTFGGRFRDLGVQPWGRGHGKLLSGVLNLHPQQNPACPRGKTKNMRLGWNLLGMLSILYHFKMIIKIKHEGSSKHWKSPCQQSSHLPSKWTSHQAADVQLWLNVGIQPQRVGKHQCSIQVIPTAKRRCFHTNLAVVVVVWRWKLAWL